MASSGCGSSSVPDVEQASVSRAEAAKEPESIGEVSDEVKASAEAFCGACHIFPSPQNFTQERWAHEVQRGFDFYFSSGRSDLTMPSPEDVTRYYRSLAPAEFEFPPREPVDVSALARFDPGIVQSEGELLQAPATAAIKVIDWGPTLGKQLVYSDMRNGGIFAAPSSGEKSHQGQLLARLRNPCRFQQVDLDGAGQIGLLVSDLGRFLPSDHNLGRVVWLTRESDSSSAFTQEVLLSDCGRVADVQCGDIDGDGDLDIVVADFGWHTTGQLLWMERISAGPATAASFKTHVLDTRSGALESRILDFDGDGKLDIIALFGQEFETVMLYTQDSSGQFSGQSIFSADPSSGSSGMEVCDLDGDGDWDVVYTNGDALDSFQIKPYHAVHWLENKGQLTFEDHQLAYIPGCHSPQVVDFDGDDDTDILVGSFLPSQLKGAGDASELASLVWLENTGGEEFEVRVLQVGDCSHAAVCVADFDQNGTMDIAMGSFYLDETEMMAPPIAILSTTPARESSQ
ncbi:FG-GAP repeat domain-containing protein [Aureliella helgolandensis]|uniref:FG-GAP repeat protein n=1 Tax=Aureliella helgolandensis TaxID=2527968 RepID=A0A518GH40_9BACT|nr:VCBS repeat-containing protein [Aureliella helgolandensis]QDV27903.1 FG-GAP repeat protein [Aureliella helgolandensis]